MTALSDRLNEAKGTDGLDVVVARAEASGHTVHRGTFANYFKGKHAKRPSEGVLQALADGLGLKVTELRELAGQPQGELGPYAPTPLANRLSKDQRRALDELIRTIVIEEVGPEHGDSSAQKIDPRFQTDEEGEDINQPDEDPAEGDRGVGRKSREDSGS